MPRKTSESVDELLDKWARGATARYYVKWKRFADEHNNVGKRNKISADLISEFEATSEIGTNSKDILLVQIG
jgi:hypothetical protein